MSDPQTGGEWREAVDTAALVLLIDSARQYGLVTGGPIADIARCQAILRRGAELGYAPRDADKLIAQFLAPGI